MSRAITRCHVQLQNVTCNYKMSRAVSNVYFFIYLLQIYEKTFENSITIFKSAFLHLVCSKSVTRPFITIQGLWQTLRASLKLSFGAASLTCYNLG